MASKFVIFAVAMGVVSAAPFTITANNYYPNGIPYEHPTIAIQEPSIAFGYGSGFSANVGGIRHSNAFGTSYKSGNAQSYGAGYAGSEDKTSASGVGSANTGRNNVYYYPVQNYQTPTVQRGDWNPQYALSSAQNYGGQGTAISQTNITPYQGTSFSTAQNQGGAATSIASGADNSGFAHALAQGDGTAFSVTQNFGGQKSSIAQAFQQNGRGLSQTSAISYNNPENQFAQSYAGN